MTCTGEQATHCDRLENLKGREKFVDIALGEKIK
jgi:hypothetical protein